MKSLFLVAVCLTLALVTSAADSLNEQLLRTLAKLDSSSDQSHNTNLYEKRMVSGDNSQISGETAGGMESGNEPKKSMAFSDFKSRVLGWAEKSNAFVQAIDAMKPDALKIMTGKKEWEDIEGYTVALIDKGFHTYGEITKEVFETWGELFTNAKGFKEAGRCRQVDRLASNIDVENDDMAGIKSFEALVSDLDCFAGEFRDTFSVLEDVCMEEDTFNPDHAMDILTNVMKTLFRMKRDGERFVPASLQIKAKFEEEKAKKTATSTKTDADEILKRILRKLQD
ncbi:hypothetical protein SNE40_015936 [Patella caerulea]|uniref:Uncharacterized protein n=1 Tax=Patella caerulea TaxID=87958 RepID=A0AAN8PHR9_PATCE